MEGRKRRSSACESTRLDQVNARAAAAKQKAENHEPGREDRNEQLPGGSGGAAGSYLERGRHL